jgi:DNA mismatch endonuclease (patch repair protein)
MLHAAGFRYRLHRADLPGKPDIVFARSRVVIFTHGCFWHLHEGCANVRIPKSRTDYWRGKLHGNRKRDAVGRRKLEALGWKVVVVWECELASPLAVQRRLIRVLEKARDIARLEFRASVKTRRGGRRSEPRFGVATSRRYLPRPRMSD